MIEPHVTCWCYSCRARGWGAGSQPQGRSDWGGRRVPSIEVDGPTHFLRPGRSATGDTLARHRAVGGAALLVGLPNWQWDEVGRNAEAEAAWLQSKVEAAVQATLAARGRGGASGSAAAAA